MNATNTAPHLCSCVQFSWSPPRQQLPADRIRAVAGKTCFAASSKVVVRSPGRAVTELRRLADVQIGDVALVRGLD